MYFLIKFGIISFAGGPLIFAAVLFHCIILSVPSICLTLSTQAFRKPACNLYNLSSFLICFLDTFHSHLPGFL